MTLTRYLKLKIADDLSADAKYNLTRIDSLGATFITDSTELLAIRSQEDIIIEPASPDIGGSGNGTLSLGQDDNPATIEVYSSAFRLRSALGLPNSTSGQPDTFLSLAADTEDLDLTLTVGLDGANRNITFGHDGVVVTEDAPQILTNKDIDGLLNTVSNISYSSLLLSNSIVNSDISPAASIATSKLSGPLTDVTGNGLGTLAGQNTASLATDVTGILPIANGGTGNDGSDRTTALIGLLPDPSGQDEKVLRYNNGTLEWYLASGTGTVQSVGLSLPSEFAVTNSPVQSIGTLTAAWNNAPAGQVFSGPALLSGTPSFRALVASDIPSGIAQSQISNLVSDLAGKEPTIVAGTAGQYWDGNKSWQTLDKSSVGLDQVDNTSDANKPISSATQTALNAKYDASNPASYVDAAGAKSASVTANINNADQTLAPDCTAVKGYVASAGGAMSFTWAAGTPASPIGGIYYKTITHNLNSLYLTVTVLDNTEEIIWVDSIVPADVDSVIVGSSQQPTFDWTVIVRPAPAP